MDLRRGSQHEYGRSRGGDGGGYASSSGRAIPPTAVPSLSTGQGFYTVESLQGATMVPPPQPAPPPPRLLPPLERYARDLPPPRLHPAERRDFGAFDRRYPPPPTVPRKMMMMPPPDMPLPRRGGPGMLHHHRPPPPPPFMGDARMPVFHPGRRDLRNGWGPGDFERHTFDRSRDRVRPSQRIKAKKQAEKTDKPAPRAKSPSKSEAVADKRHKGEGGPGWCTLCKIDCCNSDSLKKHLVGKRHKKQIESQTQVDKAGDTEEAKEEGGDTVTASVEAAGDEIVDKDNEQGETVGSMEGGMDLESTEAMVVEAPKGEHDSEAAEPKPVAGKKRGSKDVVTPKKKPRKSATSDAPNPTPAPAVKGSEEDHASEKSSISLKSKGEDSELPTSDKKPVEESMNEGMDGEKEVREVTDLESGRAGQSAEVQ
ncbi:hypothetical protein GOP47_0028218 [Adiantum capillus-veneris]|nr:hypothetical protein GOP47_0028218 [Adiantum capillus-veneris]